MRTTQLLAIGFLTIALLSACDDNAGGNKPAASATSKPSATAKATATAKPSATATAKPSAAASSSANVELPPHYEGAEIEAIKDLGDPPSKADWDAAQEVSVTGSTKASCNTKVHGKWFRAYCTSDESDGALGRLKHAKIAKGLRPGQTTVTKTQTGANDDGRPLYAFEIVTPYIEGTDFIVNLQWALAHNLDLTVQWPKGQSAAPSLTGKVVQAPDRGDR